MKILAHIIGPLIEAWGEVKVQKARVVLSLVGVVAAVAAMTVVMALGDIVLQSSREAGEAYEGRSTTLHVSASLTSGGGSDAARAMGAPGAGAQMSAGGNASGEAGSVAGTTSLLDEAMTTVADRLQIRYWSRYVSTPASLVEVRQSNASGSFRGYEQVANPYPYETGSLVAVDPAYSVLFRTRVIAGRWVADTDPDQRLTPAVINDVLWNQLGRAPIDAEPIVLHDEEGRSVRIVGVVASKTSYESPTIFVHYDSYRAAFAANASAGEGAADQPEMLVWVSPEDAERARTVIPRALSAVLGEGWEAQARGGEREEAGESVLSSISTTIMVIGGIIVFLGALGLLNVAIVTVRQRVREIGIRRAVGASAARVFFAVFMESVVATCVAGVIGVGIAILVVRFLPLDSLGIMLSDTPAFPVRAAVAGVGISTVIGALCGIIPATVAVRVRPIDAIRY